MVCLLHSAALLTHLDLAGPPCYAFNLCKSYRAGFKPGKPMASRGLALVLQSRSPQFNHGEVLFGNFEWSTHAVLDSCSQVI
jgi:NADPH-dependent curcumin reductase CurA